MGRAAVARKANALTERLPGRPSPTALTSWLFRPFIDLSTGWLEDHYAGTARRPMRLRCWRAFRDRTMKTLLSVGALVLATTVSAKAECVMAPAGTSFICASPMPVETPKQRPETAHRPAPLNLVAKRPKPHHRDPDEKAPAPVPPPALPPRAAN